MRLAPSNVKGRLVVVSGTQTDAETRLIEGWEISMDRGQR